VHRRRGTLWEGAGERAPSCLSLGSAPDTMSYLVSVYVTPRCTSTSFAQAKLKTVPLQAGRGERRARAEVLWRPAVADGTGAAPADYCKVLHSAVAGLGAPAWPAPGCTRRRTRLLGTAQATKELIAEVFRLQTEVTRLRGSIDRLGGPRDTAELRHKVCAAGQQCSQAIWQYGTEDLAYLACCAAPPAHSGVQVCV